MNQMLKEYMEKYDSDKYVYHPTISCIHGKIEIITVICEVLGKSIIVDNENGNCYTGLNMISNFKVVNIINERDVDEQINKVYLDTYNENNYHCKNPYGDHNYYHVDDYVNHYICVNVNMDVHLSRERTKMRSYHFRN